jgi:hypothetical protein
MGSIRSSDECEVVSTEGVGGNVVVAMRVLTLAVAAVLATVACYCPKRQRLIFVRWRNPLTAFSRNHG